jgi:hypothetical protein
MAFGQMATDRFPKPGAMPQAMVNIAFGESNQTANCPSSKPIDTFGQRPNST